MNLFSFSLSDPVSQCVANCVRFNPCLLHSVARVTTAAQLLQQAERARVPANTSETGALLHPFHPAPPTSAEFGVDKTLQLVREKFLNKFGNNRPALLTALRGANMSVMTSARTRHIQKMNKQGNVRF